MKITAGILFYLLDRYGDMQHICHGADRMPLSRSEHFRSQPETEIGVLYIYADKKGVLLFCAGKPLRTNKILLSALKEGDPDVSSLWIPYDNLEEEAGRRAHLADEVSEYISQIWNFFTQIQNEILEAILSQESVGDIMRKVRGVLREPFLIVDRDALLLYEHPDIAGRLRGEIGERYGEEILEELFMDKEFHEVAHMENPFYYENRNLNVMVYALNIRVDGYYYARLVVYTDPDKTTLSSGAEQLSEYLETVIVQMIRSGVLQLHRSQDDPLHVLCQKLLDEQTVKPSEAEAAIAAYQWDLADAWQVICLEPHQKTGWDTQVENTMPTLTRKLEQTLPHSCAAFSGTRILWLINDTLSGSEENTHEIRQKRMVLLRENVLQAGASGIFNGVACFASAVREAKAALRIGKEKDPSYWYYRFDDYRMQFMIDAVKAAGVEPYLLLPPAIRVLMEHDRLHESELSKTLEVFLEKRQNVTQAAEALFIHRTTLFRRLNQVKELTGLDFDRDEAMLELQLSYRILKG